MKLDNKKKLFESKTIKKLPQKFVVWLFTFLMNYIKHTILKIEK